MTWQFNETELQQVANQIKELLVDHMTGENILSVENCREVKRNWAIVVKKKGWLGEMWDRWRGQDNQEEAQFTVVRSCTWGNIGIEESEEKPDEEPEEEQHYPIPDLGRFEQL